jgi:cysteine desulfurase / selenocysteine lyase
MRSQRAQRIHLNCAGAGVPSAAVVRAITQHFELEAALGPMEAGAAAAPALAQGRENIARLIGATAAQIAFASSGSMAHGLAFAALPRLRAGERILVGRHEWGGNLASYWQAAAGAGAQVEVIPCNGDGSVDTHALAQMLDARVRLVALTWLPANGGLINDAAAIGKVTRAAGVPYFIDAGQALGQLPIDVETLQCDVLKSAGRKHLGGPRGTAILYVRQAFLERTTPAFLSTLAAPDARVRQQESGSSSMWTSEPPSVRQDARRFECGELSSALTLGLCKAVEQTLKVDLAARFAGIQVLAASLRDALADIPGVTTRDLGAPSNRSGLVAFTVNNMPAEAVKTRLAAQNLTVGANGVLYTPLDMRARGLEGVVRVSINALTTSAELEALVDAVAVLAR